MERRGNGHVTDLGPNEPRLRPAGAKTTPDEDRMLKFRMLARVNSFAAPSLLEFADIPYRRIWRRGRGVVAAVGFGILAFGGGYIVDQLSRALNTPRSVNPTPNYQTIIDQVFGPAGLSVSTPDQYRDNKIPYPPSRR